MISILSIFSDSDTVCNYLANCFHMDIEDFWDGAPDVTLEVESTWNEFVEKYEGKRVDKYLSNSPNFNNADYIFPEANVIIELKELKTEFLGKPAFNKKFELLKQRLMKENPKFVPFRELLPNWFLSEYLRIFRPPLARTLKKANKQIKETKEFFNINTPTGIAIFVNEEFVSIDPQKIVALASNILMNSYSSIDCFIYVTLNRYAVVEGDNEPKLLWIPVYSDRVNESIYEFVNNLGVMWGDFLEEKIGPFTSRGQSDDGSFLSHTKSLLLPHERG